VGRWGVVEKNDGASMQSWAQRFAYELAKASVVHRAEHRSMTHNTIIPDGADYSQVPAPVCGFCIAYSNWISSDLI